MNNTLSPTGYVAGSVFGFTLIKHIQRRNILWKPTPSLTISKPLLEAKRQTVDTLVFKVFDGTKLLDTYTISLAKFDILKQEYDYGNGVNYRIAIKDFHKEGRQGEMKI